MLDTIILESNYFDLKECSNLHPLHNTKSCTLFKRAQPRQNWQGSEVSVSQNLHDSVVQIPRFSFCREAWIRNVCRLWKSDP